MKQQRQFGAPRRRARSLAAPTPVRGARQRPEWNAYLTDSDQYKLNQQQQLQRQLQQLSTAHFVSRSPTHLRPASRPRRSPVEQHGTSRSTPQPVTPLSTQATQSVAGFSVRSSAIKTARRLQFADMPLTPVSQRIRFGSIRSPHTGSVSFYSDDASAEEVTPRRRKLNADEKAGLQSELAVLERMLWDLEAETERLGLQSQTPRGGERRVQSDNEELGDQGPDTIGLADRFEGEDAGEEVEEEVEEDDDNDGDDGGGTARRISFNDDTLDDVPDDHLDDDSRLSDVCHRSLSIGLAMTRRLEQLSKQLAEETHSRQDQELRVEVLEQELRAAQAKCTYLEAKYDNVAAQIDDMRHAVSATDDAIHRMAQAFERTRFHTGRASTPSTPHRSGTNAGSRTPSNRKHPTKSSLKQTPKPETHRHHQPQDDGGGDGAENFPPSNQ